MSPTALPISDFATGDTKEIEPAYGIRFVLAHDPIGLHTLPSLRLKVTVLPKATVSVDVGLERAGPCGRGPRNSACPATGIAA